MKLQKKYLALFLASSMLRANDNDSLCPSAHERNNQEPVAEQNQLQDYDQRRPIRAIQQDQLLNIMGLPEVQDDVPLQSPTCKRLYKLFSPIPTGNYHNELKFLAAAIDEQAPIEDESYIEVFKQEVLFFLKEQTRKALFLLKQLPEEIIERDTAIAEGWAKVEEASSIRYANSILEHAPEHYSEIQRPTPAHLHPELPECSLFYFLAVNQMHILTSEPPHPKSPRPERPEWFKTILKQNNRVVAD